MAAKIVGYVCCLAPTMNPDVVDFIVRYVVSENIPGPISGECIIQADVTLNDTQITTSLREGLAAYINSTCAESPGFAAVDVRGCNV